MHGSIAVTCGGAGWTIPAGPADCLRMRSEAPRIAAALEAAAAGGPDARLAALRDAFGPLCGGSAQEVWDAACGSLGDAPAGELADALARVALSLLDAWQEEVDACKRRRFEHYLGRAADAARG